MLIVIVIVSANGVDLNVEVHGEGVPVLMLHGWPDSSALWRAQVPVLVAHGFQVITPDLRGFGRSSRPDRKDHYQLANSVGDVAAILDACGAAQAHVVGHDWGAAVAWLTAMYLPDRVRTLTALSVPHLMAPMTRRQREMFWYQLFFQFEGVAEATLEYRDWAEFRELTPGYRDIDRAIADLSRPGALTASLNWYRLGHVDGEERAAGAGEPVPLGVGNALPGDRRGPLVLAHTAEQMRFVDDQVDDGLAGGAAAGAGDAEHLLGVVRQPPHRLLQQVGKRVRDQGAAVGAGQQLLGEERVALRPLVERVGQRAVGEAAEDRRRELFRLAAAQPGQLGPLDPVDPGQLGQQRPQRMGTVQLVGTERHHDQHVRERALVADEEGDEVAARPVGQVRVLDHQHERLLHREPLEQGQKLLEEPRAGLAGAVQRAGGAVR